MSSCKICRVSLIHRQNCPLQILYKTYTNPIGFRYKSYINGSYIRFPPKKFIKFFTNEKNWEGKNVPPIFGSPAGSLNHVVSVSRARFVTSGVIDPKPYTAVKLKLCASETPTAPGKLRRSKLSGAKVSA
jgi:hypothetical protein